ncbi:MAG: hypothetical protein OXM61_19400 [Candidatus Poribacteria bacterium]|nr:hypothetical protein [Candidatus Poribacteria bacterium]
MAAGFEKLGSHCGELGQELKNAFRELIKTFPSIDKDRMPDPKQVIRELKRTVRTIITVGKEKLGDNPKSERGYNKDNQRADARYA